MAIQCLSTLQNAARYHCEQGHCQVQICLQDVHGIFIITRFNLTHLIPRNPSQTIVRSRMDDSTSNLAHHVIKCDGPTTHSSHAINDFAHGSKYSKAEFRFLLVSWVTQCHRPFAIVDDKPLQDMFRMLYAKVDIPSAATVSRDVKEVHSIAKKNVIKVLQVLYHTNVSHL